MEKVEFGVDIEACRENFRQREEQKYGDRERLRQTAKTAILSAIERVLPHYKNVERVYLFGSITRPGKFRIDSDIDVAIKGTNAKEYFALWRDLERIITEWAIDLRELNEPCYFTQTVQQRGELIYERKDDSFESRSRS